MPSRTSRRSLRAVVSVVLFAAGTAACSYLVSEPVVTVADVQAASIGLTGGTLRVLLDVENPNPFTLRSNVFTYRLQVATDPGMPETEWLTLFDGEHPEEVRIASKERGRVELEVPFEYSTVGVVVGRLMRQGELEYRFSGSFDFRLPIGDVQVPFDEQGTFRP